MIVIKTVTIQILMIGLWVVRFSQITLTLNKDGSTTVGGSSPMAALVEMHLVLAFFYHSTSISIIS